MRVTRNLLTDILLTDLNRTVGRIGDLQHQTATGKRISKPSDDPIGTSKVLELNQALADNERFLKNVEDGSQWLTLTENALADTTDLLAQVKNLTIQALNDSLNESDRDETAIWVNDIYEDLVEVAARKVGNRYIFGGTQTTARPYALSDEISDENFSASLDNPVLLDFTELVDGSVVVTDPGGAVTYTEGVDYTIDYENGSITALSSGSMADGNPYEISYSTVRPSQIVVNPNGISGTLRRQIDDGETIEINVLGTDAFDGGLDVFDEFRQLKNALIRNDVDTIRERLDGIDAALTQVLQSETLAGTRQNRLTLATGRLENEQVTLSGLLSSVQDTDVAEAIVRLQTEQTMYEAALQMAAEVLQTSLLDFLG